MPSQKNFPLEHNTILLKYLLSAAVLSLSRQWCRTFLQHPRCQRYPERQYLFGFTAHTYKMENK